MLDFKPLKTEDKKLIEEFMPESCKQICDFSFANLYAWSVAENTQIAQKDGFLFLRCRFNGVESYAFPWGEGDIKSVLGIIGNDAVERNADFSFYCLSEEQAKMLSELYGEKLTLTEQRDYFDYVYSRDALAELKGRKFHSKKNHFNSFIKKYNYSYEEINKDNIEECRNFNRKWYESREYNPKLEEERLVIERAFDNFGSIGLSGAVLRVDGSIVAYAVGEPMADGKTYCTHFEKASLEYPEAYAAINKLFAENSLGNYTYINREDDAGSEDLRKAKTSYNPEFLIKKYYAKIN